MTARRIRVGLFSELPTPYRWPVFARLLDLPDLDLEVFFCARTERDREWRFDFRPDRRVHFLPGITLSFSGRRTVHYHVNPGVFGVLKRGRFDVVVFPGYAMFASHAGETWCRVARTPYVIFSETNRLEPRGRLVGLAKRFVVSPLVRGASAWLPTGTLSKDYLVAYGGREEAMFFFPNMPDVRKFREGAEKARTGRDEIRRRFGAGEEPVVLFVGRLIGVKRVDLLLGALARLGDLDRSPRLWIAGDGVEREALERASERTLPGRVVFLGFVATADLPAIYAAADVFVLPSDHEPWGAVVGEAMACGLPVVVSDRVGAGTDLVSDANGAVFAHGDERRLARVLRSLLVDRGRLVRMGARSVRRASEFGPDLCVSSFLRAVRTATGESLPATLRNGAFRGCRTIAGRSFEEGI